MPHYAPQSELETHTVSNQPKVFGDVDLFASDKALKGAVEKAGGGVHAAKLSEFGKRCGAFETQDWSRQAQENLPKLKSFDRFGHRLDEVDFHPAYHNLMSLGLDSGLSASAWNAGEAGEVGAAKTDNSTKMYVVWFIFV